MGKWIITDHAHPNVKQGLEGLGLQVDHFPDIGQAELSALIGDYEGLVISTRTAVRKELIDRAVNLKIVARLGSGMEHVDTAYCAEKHITCLSSPEGNANAVAEHAFGMLLTLSNRIRKAHNELANGIWKREENRGFELRGRSVGIIGYGHTGSAFARKFSGWAVDVCAYDKFRSGFGSEGIKEVGYKELIAVSDIISFHIPLDGVTRHWIDSAFIESCRPGVILINTSRGAIADSQALLRGLLSGHLGGLCLDVFEDEPIDSGRIHDPSLYLEILSFNNVVATPHIAGWSRESAVLLGEVLVSKIAAELKKLAGAG